MQSVFFRNSRGEVKRAGFAVLDDPGLRSLFEAEAVSYQNFVKLRIDIFKNPTLLNFLKSFRPRLLRNLVG